jgi:TetR/AcrR family transcriptional regulator, cholesterol catabolism regulator
MPVDKLEEIGKAALELFSQQGYLKTSMTEVATAVGLTKGGLYHHVEKKEQLLFLIHNEMADAFIARFEESYQSTNDPVEQLKNWIEAHLTLMEDYGPNVKIFFTELKHLEKIPGFDIIMNKRDKIFSMNHAIMEDGVKQKKFKKDQDPFLSAMLLNGMINWFYQWYRKDGRLPMKEIVKMVQSFVLSGVLK